MAQSRTSRDHCKTPARHTGRRLVREAGLNRAQARVTLDILTDHMQHYASDTRPEGVIIHTAVSKDEPAGKPLCVAEMVPVRLTYFHAADAEVQAARGTVEMRMARLHRICWEAHAQNGLLSHEDLAFLLAIDPSTVRDLIRRLRAIGLSVPTRGAIKDIGPSPSHRRIIARLLAEGRTTSEIRSVTGHSENAIGRYQAQFASVLYFLHYFPDATDNERRALTGLRACSYYDYVAVYEEVVGRPECQPHLERLRRRYELDPEGVVGFPPRGKRPNADPLGRLEQQNLATVLRQTIQEDLATTRRIAEAVAEDLLQAVEKAYRLTEALHPGEVVIQVDRHDPSSLSGEKVSDRPVLSVRVPLYTEQAREIWRRDEPTGRRRALLACLTANAVREQGGIMSIAGLAELLHTSPSTLGKDLRELAIEMHIEAPTKGLIEDAGPTLTHKDWIIDLDEHGLTGAEISWLTFHSPISRDRYIETYRRVELLARLEGAIPEPAHVAHLFRIRPHVAAQYVQILRRRCGDGNCAQANASPDASQPPDPPPADASPADPSDSN